MGRPRGRPERTVAAGADALEAGGFHGRFHGRFAGRRGVHRARFGIPGQGRPASAAARADFRKGTCTRMKRTLLAALFALPLLACSASDAAAQCSPWGGPCFRLFPGAMFHGPLYNYGPYEATTRSPPTAPGTASSATPPVPRPGLRRPVQAQGSRPRPSRRLRWSRVRAWRRLRHRPGARRAVRRAARPRRLGVPLVRRLRLDGLHERLPPLAPSVASRQGLDRQ